MEPLPRSWLIMVSLCTILHGHGILAKIMARSWQGYQGTCHGSWQGCYGFEHWARSKDWWLPGMANHRSLPAVTDDQPKFQWCKTDRVSAALETVHVLCKILQKQ